MFLWDLIGEFLYSFFCAKYFCWETAFSLPISHTSIKITPSPFWDRKKGRKKVVKEKWQKNGKNEASFILCWIAHRSKILGENFSQKLKGRFCSTFSQNVSFYLPALEMHSRSKTRVSNFLFFSGRCHKFLGILIAWVSYYGLLQAVGSQILDFLIVRVSNFDLFQKGGSQ